MTLVKSTILGPYEILSKLGAGGMGEVYMARDSRLERDVALKVLPEKVAQDPDALARFQRESKAVAALSHPNIRTLFDIGTEDERTFAVMELLEGETLADRLKRSALDWRKAAQYGQAIANGLAAAHAKGIIHRDIKPQNIFLTADGDLKILDFGLARIETNGPMGGTGLTATRTLQTQVGSIMGTVQYMSPEQVRGQPADARSDIFAFGCVLYEMLTGDRPFHRPTNAETMAAVLNDDPPVLADAGFDGPAELQRIAAHCLEKNPEQRFQSARDLAFALKGVDSAGAERTTDKSTQRATQPQTEEETEASVAVLPFTDMSPQHDQDYFCDGMAEELINALSKVEGLRVASRTSASAFKGKQEDIRKIGDQLSVRTVLEGSVRKAGDRLRINAQLVNVADGYQLWSGTFDRNMEDVFAVQDEIAQAITRALRVVLTEKEKHAIAKAPTDNVQAYECYLRGRQYFHQFHRKGLERARKLFMRAYELDAEYAGAYAGVADCCSMLYTYCDATEAHLKEADQASRKALELDPQLAEAHVARGLAASLNKQYDEARREFETAIRQNPELFEAHYFYARSLFAEGKLGEAAQLFEQASQRRPEDYVAPSLLGNVNIALGHQEEAQAAYRRSVSAAEKHLELFPEDGRALYMGAVGMVQLGQCDRALEWAERALAAEPEEPWVLYNVACAYALLGQSEKAIDCLDDAITFGMGHKEWFENDSDLNSLRDHPRFSGLLERL
ncbi:MAG: protein kinase [Planctomycetota bacterium]|nr:protein kinase [Planctomycetota bacterium]